MGIQATPSEASKNKEGITWMTHEDQRPRMGNVTVQMSTEDTISRGVT